MTATIAIGQQVTQATFYIVEGVDIAILGLDALEKLRTKIDTTTGQVVMGEEIIIGSRKNISPSNIQMVRCHNLCITEHVTVQPGQECFLKARVCEGDVPTWGGIVEATERFMEQTGLLTCAVQVGPGQASVPICVTNIWDKPAKTKLQLSLQRFPLQSNLWWHQHPQTVIMPSLMQHMILHKTC